MDQPTDTPLASVRPLISALLLSDVLVPAMGAGTLVRSPRIRCESGLAVFREQRATGEPWASPLDNEQSDRATPSELRTSAE